MVAVEPEKVHRRDGKFGIGYLAMDNKAVGFNEKFDAMLGKVNETDLFSKFEEAEQAIR